MKRSSMLHKINCHTNYKEAPDKLKGWRIDYDPDKGFHVNWWDKTRGRKKKDWRLGAISVQGKTWLDFTELVKHFN